MYEALGISKHFIFSLPQMLFIALCFILTTYCPMIYTLCCMPVLSFRPCGWAAIRFGKFWLVAALSDLPMCMDAKRWHHISNAFIRSITSKSLCCPTLSTSIATRFAVSLAIICFELLPNNSFCSASISA